MQTQPARSDGVTRRLAAPVAIGVVLLLAVGGSVLLTGGNDDSVATVATADFESTTTLAAAPAAGTAPVFVNPSVATVPAPVTVASTTTSPPTTVRATTTTSSTTTTTTVEPVVTETLPEQPPQPIAPPPDPKAAEDQVQLGAIRIPKLGVDAPLLEGIRLTTLDNGPGHWPGTAMPGQVGNVVVAAHRTSHGGPFRNIDQLVVGDVVQFETADGLIDYSVTKTHVVNPEDVWIVNPTETPTATLFACHPPGSVKQRIVVNLELAD